MTDIDIDDLGFIHPQIIPEPDSPLTVMWGSMIARAVARITKPTRRASVLSGGSVFYSILGGGDYLGVPIVKAYFKSGTAYNDYEVMGTGCSISNDPSACSHLGYKVVDGPSDLVYFEWGTLNGTAPTNRTDNYTLWGYGR